MSETIDTAPHWKVNVQRRGAWAFVPDQPRQPDLLTPPPPREFGVRYLAALEGAAQLLHGADAVVVERFPPFSGAEKTAPETPPLAGPPAPQTEP